MLVILFVFEIEPYSVAQAGFELLAVLLLSLLSVRITGLSHHAQQLLVSMSL